MNTTPEFSIKITGNHYFGCDYIFSNIYGSAVFADDFNGERESLEGMVNDPEKGDFSEATFAEYAESDSEFYDFSTLPECNKEIEYSTLGTLTEDGDGGLFIRYSGDFSPVCMHITKGGLVTLNGEEDDFSELVFENGKRNYVALPESVFSPSQADGGGYDDGDMQSPIQLCVDTKNLETDISEAGVKLKISYSIEVNGITAEVSDITLTARPCRAQF